MSLVDGFEKIKGKIMNNLKIEVTPEDFAKIEDTGKQLVVIYKAMVGQQKHCEEICEINSKKFIKLEKRKKVDTGIASTLGLIGGFISQWVKNIVT